MPVATEGALIGRPIGTANSCVAPRSQPRGNMPGSSDRAPTMLVFRCGSRRTGHLVEVAVHNELQQHIVDAETGQRGFLLTGEDIYLQPYYDAASEVAPTLDRIDALSYPGGLTTPATATSSPARGHQAHDLERTASVRRARGADPARAIVVTDVGRMKMEAIRADLETRRWSRNLVETEMRRRRTASVLRSFRDRRGNWRPAGRRLRRPSIESSARHGGRARTDDARAAEGDRGRGAGARGAARTRARV